MAGAVSCNCLARARFSPVSTILPSIKNYCYLSDTNPENNFNIEEHLSTKLTLKSKDKYEVIEIDLSSAASVASLYRG